MRGKFFPFFLEGIREELVRDASLPCGEIFAEIKVIRINYF